MRAGAHCLALVTDAFGGHGGIAQYNRDFLGALAEGSAPSSITVLPRHAPERTAAPAAINQLPARRGRLSYAATALLMAFRRRVDVVFCGHLYLTPLAWLIARLKGAKLVLQMHGIEAWPRPSRLQRAATETADLVLCVSRYTRACVIGWAAMASERVVVVPDMVGDGFTPGDGRELRAALGIEAKRVLLTVGRMDSRERYKGHDRVIAAIPDLVTWGHDVVYLIIGKGDDRARLEQLARENGGAERIRFLGAIDKERLVDAYRMADLFVMPSTGEGFGIAFLEAMASGTPALGFAVAGARDALADGELGTTVLEDDLSDAIARLLAMPTRTACRRQSALASVAGYSRYKCARRSIGSCNRHRASRASLIPRQSAPPPPRLAASRSPSEEAFLGEPPWLRRYLRLETSSACSPEYAPVAWTERSSSRPISDWRPISAVGCHCTKQGTRLVDLKTMHSNAAQSLW
jgi:phosphatidylinositol alpha-1,6-mannosyltransferase